MPEAVSIGGVRRGTNRKCEQLNAKESKRVAPETSCRRKDTGVSRIRKDGLHHELVNLALPSFVHLETSVVEGIAAVDLHYM